MFNVGVIQAILRLKDEMSKGLIKAQKNLKRTGADVKKAGKVLAAFGVGAIAVGAKFGMMAADFENGMREVATISGETAANFDEVSNKVLALGPELGNTAELTAGLYGAISAGAETVDEGLALVTQGAKLAGASLTDTGTATALLSKVINGYGLAASEAEQVSDFLFTTVKKGVTTMEELAPQIGRVIPNAAAMGVQFQDVAAAMAALTANSFSTEQATTSLDAIMRKLMKPTSGMKDQARALGFEFSQVSDLAAGPGGLKSALEFVKEQVGGNTEAMAKLFEEGVAISGMLALTGKGFKAFGDAADAMSESLGNTEAAFQEMQKSASAAMDRLKNSLEKAAISIGAGIAPIMSQVADTIGTLVAKFNALSPALKATIGKWVVVAGGVSAVAGALILLTPALVAAVGVIMGPVGLIAAAAALVLSLKPVRKWIAEKIPQAVPFLVGALKATFASFKMVELGLTSGMKAWTLMMARAEVTLANQAAALDQNAETVGRAIDAAFALEAAEDAVRNAADITAAEIENFNTTLDDLVTAAAGGTGGGGGAAKAVDDLNDSIVELAPSIDPWATSWNNTAISLERFNVQALRVSGNVPQMTNRVDAFTAAGVTAEGALADYNRTAGETNDTNEAAVGFWGRAVNAILQFGRQVIDMFSNLFNVQFPAWATAGTNAVLGFLDTISNPTKWQDWVSIGLSAAAALIGGIKAILGKKAGVADHIANWFQRELSQGLIDAMEAARAQTGGDIAAAFRLLISDAIEEATIDSLADLQSWITQVHQVLSSVDEGTLSAEQAIKSMGAAWLALIPAMEQLGGNAMDLQRQFSDLITRFGATPEVIAQITAAILAMEAAGVAGVGELVDWLATLGVTIEGVMTSAERAQAAFEDWQDAVAIVVDLKAELEALRAGADKLSQMAAQVTDAFSDMGVGGIASAQSIRDKWKAMAESGALSWADAQRFMRAELDSTKAAALAAFKAQAAAAGFSAEDQDRVANELYAAWRANVRATEIAARKAVRQQAIDARKELRQEIKDARHAARQKFLLFRDLAKKVAGPGGTFDSIGSAWAKTVGQMIKDGQRFFDAMVGDSVFPDVEAGAIKAADAIANRFEGGFADMATAGAGFEHSVVSTSGMMSAPPGGAPGAVTTQSNAGVERRLESIERALRAQPDAIGNAVQHRAQTDV